MRHIFSETWSGLRRNFSMTVAVIVTMWVSLSLFGGGLMIMQQVDLMKGGWYDKIEISVYLCTEETTGGTCEPGQATTDGQREYIEKRLNANPEVLQVFYESKEEAYVKALHTWNSAKKEMEEWQEKYKQILNGEEPDAAEQRLTAA